MKGSQWVAGKKVVGLLQADADNRYVNVTGDTMSGALTLANLTNALNSGNYPIQMMSGVADGATAVGYLLNTTSNLANASAKLFSLKNFGVEKMWLGNSKGSFGDSNTVTDGFAFGNTNTVNGSGAFAVGSTNNATGLYAVAIGSNSQAVDYGLAVGNTSLARGPGGSVALAGGDAYGYASFAVGADNHAGDGIGTNGFYGVVLGGYTNHNNGFISSMIGLQNNMDSGTYYSNAMGDNNTFVSAYSGVGIGSLNTINNGGIAIGSQNTVNSQGTLALGTLSSAQQSGDSALGYAAVAYGGNSFAIGSQLTAWGANSVAVGSGVRNAIDSSFMFGTGSITDTAPGIFMSSARSNFDTTRFAIARNTSVGTEMVTNGTFTGSAAGWTLGTDWSYGTNNVTKIAGATSGTVSQALTGFVIGQVYVLSYKATFGLAEDQTQYLTPSLSGAMSLTFGNRTRTMIVAHKEVFIATATTATLNFTPTGATQTMTLDDVSVKPCTGGQLSVAGKTYLNSGAILGAGTTTILPLQFTSGTLLTTALAGGVEFLNDNYYATITTGAKRKTIEFQENYSQSFLLMGT